MTTRETDYGLLMPWMPEILIGIYTAAYIEYGTAELAWAAVRQAPEYQQFFPGNRREDGTLRLSEQEYMATLDAYDDVFQSVGLNPQLWRERYVDLIEGDVSADELMAERVMPIYERIVEGSEFIRQQYATDWGVDLSFEAILAAALDPEDIGSRILQRQIALSEIGGEALESGFDINRGLTTQLLEAGVDREAAARLFARAEAFVPALSVLAARHADPDDAFDLEEFVASDIFDDPVQTRRIRRLLAQEQATFRGGAQVDYVRGRTGGVVGLQES